MPGFRILGIKVDNPTGEWIFIQSNNSRYNWYVPPYTIQFSKALDPTVISVKLIAGNGPAGRKGSSTGTNWTAIVSDKPFGDSDGLSIIAGDKPPITWIRNSQDVNGGSAALLFPPAGQSLRIFSIIASTTTWGALNTRKWEGEFYVTFAKQDPFTAQITDMFTVTFNSFNRTQIVSFPGLDFNPDESLIDTPVMIYGPVGLNNVPFLATTVVYGLV